MSGGSRRLSGTSAADIESHPSDGWVLVPFETGQLFEAGLAAHHTDQPVLQL